MDAVGQGPREVIVFDGVCRLCSGWVRFVASRDPAGRFAFVPFQSGAARRVLARCGSGLDPSEGVLLVTGSVCLARSDAALAIAAGLEAPWPVVARLARLWPRPLREAVYRLVARRRYRWFGRRDACFVPDAALRARFVTSEDDDA